MYWLILLLLLPGIAMSQDTIQALPRSILALYDSRHEPRVRYTNIHKYAEMPLNHLGYRLLYHDVHTPLPNMEQRDDIAGILTWFPSGSKVSEPRQYIHWMTNALKLGKKLVVVGNPGFYAQEKPLVPIHEVNQLWSHLGLKDLNSWTKKTYDTQLVIQTPALVGFEREYQGALPGFRNLQPLPNATVHLLARQHHSPVSDIALIATNPHGGYCADEYELFIGYIQDNEYRAWYLNPFLFFRLTFDQKPLPKTDTTTLAGRRIYYSHIDGDGWNNLAQLEEYRNQPLSCAEVLFKDILKPYDDLPCTVAPIAADISLNWVGTERSRAVTRNILGLPHIEVGCHTYTHPFDWYFFADYKPEIELPYLDRYVDGSWLAPSAMQSFKQSLRRVRKRPLPLPENTHLLNESYQIPRAYALKPFDLTLETEGAIQEVQKTAPHGKNVMVYQWSGDCLPFEAALRKVREAGIVNLNGGSTRFDDEFSSYSYVFPLGRLVGNEQQIYATNSNENTYTNMWLGKYYGFNKLPITFANTESPIRICPMNLYYHVYSTERLASFEALTSNLDYVRSQEIAPIAMSQYASIVGGFYQAEIYELGPSKWKIGNRGALQTIRFDHATQIAVDFSQSKGVIGQRYLQGSLYVYLDASENEPVIALEGNDDYWTYPSAHHPYLIDSRWPVRDVQTKEETTAFTTNGFGAGQMRWRVKEEGSYQIKQSGKEDFLALAKEGILSFALSRSLEPIRVEISRQMESAAK